MTHAAGLDPDPEQASPESAPGRLRRAERYVIAKLTWSRLYRTASYLRSALWIAPFVAILIVLVLAPALQALDRWLDWTTTGLAPAGAQALYQTVITLTLSFMVFTFGSLLVAIQVASGQLTPRIIATTLLRDQVVKYSVGLFVFTLVFSVMALNRLGTKVPELVALITALLGIACISTFLFLIDYAARLLRPVSILAKVGDEGIAAIRSIYPDRTTDAAERTPPAPPGATRRIVLSTAASGSVLAVDLTTLVAQARRTDGVIEFLPRVGEFVATDEPLFALHGGAASLDEGKLRETVVLGPERTIEQDPLFAFRILVDIGLKALSPAINDPTTAVLALDQVHRLLRAVGKRRLHAETIADASGRTRVVFRTPNWEDFVDIAFTEIRNCGAGSVQVARRLYAMIDNLIEALPARRHAALAAERRRLDEATENVYGVADDRTLARIPDSQGLGSPHTREAS